MPPKKLHSASVDPLTTYLKEIDASPLLTPQMEQTLAQQKEEGNPEAKEHLIRSNLRLVVSIARTKLRKGICLEDAIQAGNLGLIAGARKYKARNIRFSTFSSYSINRQIDSTADNERGTIHIPLHVQHFQRKLLKVKGNLHTTLGREPTDEELREAMELNARKWNTKKKLSAHAERAKTVKARGETGEDTVQLDAILSQKEKDPVLDLQRQEAMNVMLHLVETLDPHLQEIIRMRYLDAGQKAPSRTTVGEVLHMPASQIRKHELNALARLRQLLSTHLGLKEQDVLSDE